MGSSRDGRDYFSNHVSQSSSLEEVHRLDGVQQVPPAPRLVEMRRDPVLGFGFVAGSEKPVVVRSVTPGGPSEAKLNPGDEIIMINDEAVSSAPRERVIDLVRNCKESIMLTVVQPYPSPKSAFISAAKKAKLKSNPVKVRFAEEVIINGQVPNTVKDNSLLFMQKVLKVYLENGQTKSFRFDCSTSIKDVIMTLQEKLSIKCIEHFSLMLEQRTEGSGSKLLLLHEQEMLTRVTQRPGSDKMKCFFRISFVPKDPVDLLRRDAVAFEYLYVQSCNDVVLERFGSELKYDAALRLAALQMYVLTMTTRQLQKVSLKYIQKEWGLTLFIPPAVMTSMKEKNIKKALTHILKTNQNLVPPGKKLTALQAKVHYLKYLSELRLYGGRVFKSILLQGEKQTEVTLLVGPRYGISHVINAKTNLMALLADFSHVNRIEILTEDDINVRVELHVMDVRPITLIMESSDAMNLACLTAGYYRLLVDSRRSIFNMAHCNSIAEEMDQDNLLEWPYSTSLDNCEDPNAAGQDERYSSDMDFSNNGGRVNNISPYIPERQHHTLTLQQNERPSEGRRSPQPPPLPPARNKPQDSPRSAKVSFIFGDPPLNTVNPQNFGYERLMDESPEVPEHRPIAYLHSNVNNPGDFRAQVTVPFQFADGMPHVVYSNIGEELVEEPLLRDLCYADTTDDAEDEDDASCEEDSTGTGGGEGGGGGTTAASKATILTLSGSSDDIIDLTSLPPPEGGDDDDDDTDGVLHSLNLAIAAPPPGFRDSSDEESPESRPLATAGNNDMPVSLIDAVPTGSHGEGSGRERRLEDAVVTTLQALEALTVSEERPHPPRPQRPQPNSNPGVQMSRTFSPESSSDSGNETNSSEMTETMEQAAAHKLIHQNHRRLLIATSEGYQPLTEEKTNFPISPRVATQKKAHSPSQHQDGGPPSSTALPKQTLHPDDIELDPETTDSLTNLSSDFSKRPNSVVVGGKRLKKLADTNGKFNTFSTRDGHRGSQLDVERTSFCERLQRRPPLPLPENSISIMAENLAVNSLPKSHRRLPRPPPPHPERTEPEEEPGEAAVGATGAMGGQQEEYLGGAAGPFPSSPTKKPRDPPGGQGDAPGEQRQQVRQGVARLCEYHLAKRISSLQSEAHNSLQGSQCSSLDAGCSTGSSACGTPTDSPLCAPDGNHHPLSESSTSLRVFTYEDKAPHGTPGQIPVGRDLHPQADPTLLRKMLPNIHPPGSDTSIEGSLRSAKMKETTGSTARRSNLQNDLHAKTACVRGANLKEGNESYRQLINYLTVSQMHQGGRLHSAGLGGGVRKDTRRYITSNPQLIEMVRSKGNTIHRYPCMPPLVLVTLPQPESSEPQCSHLTGVEVRPSGTERRSSFSGLESELERGAIDPEVERFLSLRDNIHGGGGGGGMVHRPPSRARSLAQSSWGHHWERKQEITHQLSLSRPEPVPRLRPPPPPPPPPPPLPANMSTHNSTVPKQSTVTYGQNHIQSVTASLHHQYEPNMNSLQRGRDSSMNSLHLGREPSTNSLQRDREPSINSLYLGREPSINSLHLGRELSINSLHLGRELSTNSLQRDREPSTNILHLGREPSINSLQRGRELRRSTSNVTAGSGSVEVLFDKGRTKCQQGPVDPKLQRRPTRKRLSKSYSQGSVASTCWSAGGRDSRRASVMFPLQKDAKHMKGSQKMDSSSPWRCNGPFSYCFFKRKSQAEEDEVEGGEMGERGESSRRCHGREMEEAASIYGLATDAAGDQLYSEVLTNMSFSDRLSRINTLKDRMYIFPVGFSDVRRDASELIALVRSSVGRGDRSGQVPQITADLSQYKQLLSIESKELGRACRRMAQAHGSPEEMLLAITCSFQVLCCLSEACMCLVRGLRASAAQQQREVVAKVDELVMNYICLLRAAEAASIGVPSDHNVNALVRHSSTMSAIANALTRSLKTLLSK
uniref:FERM and PDZ domain-containing protein 4-like n=1 Tax=Oncorhynchus gorbuscha TaxID=8017 RepID=UPI001EAF7B55|nr:FERM and PDZ domain-containing protein 4-like [Oncorhynchus gorbuscha]